MTKTAHHDEKIAKMTFASVYPQYVTKVEKKGRTKEELKNKRTIAFVRLYIVPTAL